MMQTLATTVALLLSATSITGGNVTTEPVAMLVAEAVQRDPALPRERDQPVHVISIELKLARHAPGIAKAYELDLLDTLGAYDDVLLIEVPAERSIWALLETLNDDKRVKEAELLSALESPATATGLFWVWGLFWAWGDTDKTLDEVRTTYESQPQLDGLRNAVPGSGAGVTVAVIDTGIDADHWLLEGHIAPGGRDFIDGDADPAEAANGLDDDGDGLVDEGFGHGTYVASLIAAMAPDATILPIRALDDDGTGDAWNIARAVDYAVEQGADVINLSLGSGERQRMLKRLISDYAEVHGIVVVAAAGNTGSVLQTYPAGESDAIGVGAVDAAGQRAAFSAHGPWVDLAAPGTDLAGAYPGGHVITWDGTSAASAVTAGLAAKVRSSDPVLTPVAVKQRLAAALSVPNATETASEDMNDD